MIKEVFGFKGWCVFGLLFVSNILNAQIMHSGQITFKKKTNLEKRFQGGSDEFGRNNRWQKEPKYDSYVLYFNDTSSLFLYVPPLIGEEDREWSTTKTTTYMDIKEGTVQRQFSIAGSELYLKDSLSPRKWIITGGGRDIAGYKTKQAMWKANDSTRIYAWYSEQIAPTVGPETFFGLPGAILGLAIEDGGVVYFAEKVEPLKNENFLKKMPTTKKDEYYSEEKLIAFIKKELSKRKDANQSMLYDVIIW